MVPHQAFLSFTISQSLFKFTSVELVILSNHLIFCCPLLLCLQSFSASTSFPMSWFFPSGNQSIGASASVLSMNIQGWFPSGLTGLISLLSKGLSRVFSNCTVWKHQFFSTQPPVWSNCHICACCQEKTIAFTTRSFVSKVMTLLFNTRSEVKASAWDAGDPGSIPGSGRTPGEGNGNPLQYSCLENSMDWGAW